MKRTGTFASWILAAVGLLVLCGVADPGPSRTLLTGRQVAPVSAPVTGSLRLPEPGVQIPGGDKRQPRPTFRTSIDLPKVQAPMREVDLTAATKQNGVLERTPSILTPQLKQMIEALSDPQYLRSGRQAPALRVDPSLRPADKGAPPWGADRLLANPTDMNDEYVSLAADPTTGALFAVFAATDLGGTDRDIHIARSADQGLNWTVWEMPSFAGDEYHPELAVDGGGYLHVVWVRDDGFLLRTRSSYPGDPTVWEWVLGFEAAEPLATPSIAVSGAGAFAKVFIAMGWYTLNWDWLQYEWTLLFMYSSNGGQTVAYDYFIPDGYQDLWPDVTMDQGTVHFINAENDPYTGATEILIATDSFDGCFCDPGSLTGWTPHSTGFPRIVCEGDNVFLVYQHDFSDGLTVDGDIIYSYSWDAGASFYGPYGMIADEYESVGPTVFNNGGVVGCLWLDGPAGADEFYLAGRMGSGFGHIDMFGEVERISDEPRVEPMFHSCAGVAAAQGAAAAWIDRRDYPTQGHNVYSSRRGVAPDLSEFVPVGWDSSLTASNLRGGRTAEWLAAGDSTFVSFAFLNDGLADITATFDIDLELDGTLVGAWVLSGGLTTGTYVPVEDYPLMVGAGEHTLTVTVDSGAVVPETDETDNTFSRSLTWVAGDPVLRLDPDSVTRVIIPDTAAVAQLVADPPLRRQIHLPKISPRLAESAQKALPGHLLRVVVVPAERLDPVAMAGALRSVDRSTRRRAVLDAARTVALRHESDIAPLVDSLIGQGIARPARSLWLPQVSIVETTAEGVAALAGHPCVGRLWLDDTKSRTYLEPHTAGTAGGPATSPNPDKALAWHLSAIGADQAWAAGFDGDGILVGHIDTGIAYDHPDLVGHMWDGGPEFPNHGYDAVDGDTDPYDGDTDWYHGTHTSGLIVSDGSAGTTCGSAPGAILMALRAVPGYMEDLVEAQQFALDHGAQVLSMSAGWTNPPDDVRAANRYNSELFLSIDLPAVAAAGNGDNYGGHNALPTDIASPGDCPNPYYTPGEASGSVITVASIHQDLRVSGTSSIGPTAWNIDNPHGTNSYRDHPYPPGLLKPDVAAPGEMITSCTPGGGYITYSGTSMACPLVTGTVCILLQASPGMTPFQLAEVLETTAIDLTIAPSTPGRDAYTGAGLINIPAALGQAPASEIQLVSVINDGVMPLILGSPTESAVWLAVGGPDAAIAPGDTAAITLSFDTATLVPGVYNVSVSIPSNDPDSPHALPVTLIYGDALSAVGDGPQPHPLPHLTGHPNPFNPRTILSFDIEREGRVRLEVFDLRGRVVRTLVDARRHPGRHQVVWDGMDDEGRSVPSGTYLVRLRQRDTDPVTGKLMLVR